MIQNEIFDDSRGDFCLRALETLFSLSVINHVNKMQAANTELFLELLRPYLWIYCDVQPGEGSDMLILHELFFFFYKTGSAFLCTIFNVLTF